MADGSLKVKSSWLSSFGLLEVPILYIKGNHEQLNPKQDMIDQVRMTNIKYLGKFSNFMHKGVNFIGPDYECDLHNCLATADIKDNIPNVFLYHVTEIGPQELKEYNIFLFLAGHTHVGHIFPLNLFSFYVNKCFKGLYSDQEKMYHVFVSEGVNNAVVPMRMAQAEYLVY